MGTPRPKTMETPTKPAQSAPRTNQKRKRKSIVPAATVTLSEVADSLGRYLTQYDRTDRLLCEQLTTAATSPLLEASKVTVYRFVCRYGVSRTFPGLTASSHAEVLQPVTEFLHA